MRPLRKKKGFGWRWVVPLIYLTIVSCALGVLIYSYLVYYTRFVEIYEWYKDPALIALTILLPGLGLYLFRTQAGWVYATSLTSAVLVLSAIGALAELIPGFLPINTGWAPVITGFVSALLASGVFYLLSHRQLRAAFRVPRSWVGRCVTLGGMIGTGAGLYLIWLVR